MTHSSYPQLFLLLTAAEAIVYSRSGGPGSLLFTTPLPLYDATLAFESLAYQIIDSGLPAVSRPLQC